MTEADFVRILNAEVVAESARLMGLKNNITQAIIKGINAFLEYGQSLSTGYQSHPALTKTFKARYANKMVGLAVRPDQGASNTWVPIGNSQLHDLIANVTGSGNPRPIMNDLEVSQLPIEAGNEGESPIVSTVNFIRDSYLDASFKDSD
ncbi:tail fiber protein [Pectobacterium phage MA14]|nr:tail fiber protein [Pectobacterium phage MA14]